MRLLGRGCSTFERFSRHLSGNERSHNSRHGCGTGDAIERMIRRLASAVPTSVAFVEP